MVGIISIFKQNITKIGEPDANISVNRSYSKVDGSYIDTNDFKLGDIIRVELSCVVGEKAIDSSYVVTDFLPSGLKAIEGTSDNFIRNNDKAGFWWHRYKNVDGQKVRFYVYKDSMWNDSFVYYARVISPGVYKAESAIAQGTRSKDSINTSEGSTINVSIADKSLILKDDIKVIVNGKELVCDISPVVKDDRVIVPFRAIFEALGAKVDWNENNGTVTGQKDDLSIELKVNSKAVMVNGNTTFIDVAPQIIDDRTMVPVRFISESIGAKVDWNEETKTVVINSK